MCVFSVRVCRIVSFALLLVLHRRVAEGSRGSVKTLWSYQLLHHRVWKALLKRRSYVTKTTEPLLVEKNCLISQLIQWLNRWGLYESESKKNARVRDSSVRVVEGGCYMLKSGGFTWEVFSLCGSKLCQNGSDVVLPWQANQSWHVFNLKVIQILQQLATLKKKKEVLIFSVFDKWWQTSLLNTITKVSFAKSLIVTSVLNARKNLIENVIILRETKTKLLFNYELRTRKIRCIFLIWNMQSQANQNTTGVLVGRALRFCWVNTKG